MGYQEEELGISGRTGGDIRKSREEQVGISGRAGKSRWGYQEERVGISGRVGRELAKILDKVTTDSLYNSKSTT